MSLAACIPGLLESQAITPEQAKRALDLFEELAAELRRSMAPSAAEAQASARTVAALAAEAAETRRRAMLRADLQLRNEQWLRAGGESWGRGARKTDGAAPPGQGEAGAIDPRAGRSLIGLMEARRKTIRGRAFGLMGRLLAANRRTVTGKLRNPALLDDIGRAAFEESVEGSRALAAGEMAGSYQAARDMLRQRANAAGANIGKIERYGLPNSHDSRLVADAGFEEWFAFERENLDLDRMLDWGTGERFTPQAFERAMRGAHANIASDGGANLKPGAHRGGGMASGLAEHRFMIYKDYAAWKRSHERFGGAANPLDAMIGQIEGLSRTIAAMEVLDPNPEHGARWLVGTIAGDERLFEPGQLRARDGAKVEAWRVQNLWDEYRGAHRDPVSRRLALAFSSYRAVAGASKLGRAFLTAQSDHGFRMTTRHFNGLPQTGLMRDYLKMFNPADESDRLMAAEFGYIAETWTDVAAGQSRLLGEELTAEWARRTVETVLRGTALNAHTDAGRGAEYLVWLRHVSAERGKDYDTLEPAFRAALRRYRIGAAEWDALRATRTIDHGGREWIKPQNVEDSALGDRLMELAHSEVDYAVLVPDLETRAVINRAAKPGTWLGELARSSPLMFRTFQIAMLSRGFGRMMDQPRLAGKAGYLIALMVPATMFSALATQLYEISKGRDPRPMQDPAFWGHAMTRSGGASILGDLLGLTAQERHMGWLGYLSGPLAGDAGRAAGAAWGMGKNRANALGFDVERDERALYRLGQVARQNIPGQNAWYLELGVDRLVADHVQTLIDPDYRNAWRRMERRAEEMGQNYWWEPGETAPERAPDLANAWAGEVPE